MSLLLSHFSKPTKLFWDIKLIPFFNFHFLFPWYQISQPQILRFSFTDSHILHFWTTKQWSASRSVLLKCWVIKYIWSLSSIHQNEINHTINLPVMSGPNVWMFQWRDMELFTWRFFDATHFTNPTPLSLLVSSKPVNLKLVSGLQVSSLLNFVQNSPNNTVYDTLRTYRTPAAALTRNCHHYHHRRLSWECKFREVIPP
jgi:hypothetical protein